MFNEEITVLKREQAKPKNFLLKLLVLLNRDKNNQQKLPCCSILAYKCITFRGIQDDGSRHIKSKWKGSF